MKPCSLILAVVLSTVALVARQQPPPQTPPASAAQTPWVPPDPTNLKVLPKTISKRDLVLMMRGFTRGLGVRCPYCHVGKEGDDLSTFDFASDEKAPKQTARAMTKILAEINQSLAAVGDKPAGEPRARCYTCHRGDKKPLFDRPAGG